MSMLPILAFMSHPPSREHLLDSLFSVSVGGLVIEGLNAYSFSLGFSVLWLLWGWVDSRKAAHYAVPNRLLEPSSSPTHSAA